VIAVLREKASLLVFGTFTDVEVNQIDAEPVRDVPDGMVVVSDQGRHHRTLGLAESRSPRQVRERVKENHLVGFAVEALQDDLDAPSEIIRGHDPGAGRSGQPRG
jgi:hypothetical protein